MKYWASFLLFIFSISSHAQSYSGGVPMSVQIIGGSLPNTVTSDQGTANTTANAWPVKPTDGTNSQSYTASGESKVLVTPLTNSSVIKSQLETNSGSAVEFGQELMSASLPVTISSNQSAIPASQSGAWNIGNITGSISLPTGASTAANQTTGNTSLSDIDSKLNTLGQKTMTASAPVTIASDQSAIPASQSGAWNITNISGVVSLPTGASTAANQTTGNSSLSSIDSKLNTLGQKAMAASVPVTIASDQSAIGIASGSASIGSVSVNPNLNGSQSTSTATTTASTLTAPANAIGFFLQASDQNTANLRWAVGSVASSTSGQQLQPGRDSGYIPIGENVSVAAESGTQEYEIQWVIK